MIFRKFDNHKPYFQSVAIATLLVGAAILALGIVELLLNIGGNANYSAPMFKIVGGLIVTSLGYIHLELEMLRIK